MSYERAVDELIIKTANAKRKTVRRVMREEKLYIKLDGYEQSILVRALNDLRNSLLENARSTDAVDELIIKTANAKRKTVRGKENYEER